MKRKNKEIKLPPSCWGRVLLFSEDISTYLSLIYSIKGLYSFINNVDSSICRNIIFEITECNTLFEEEKAFPHVRKLRIGGEHFGFGEKPFFSSRTISGYLNDRNNHTITEFLKLLRKIFLNLEKIYFSEVFSGGNGLLSPEIFFGECIKLPTFHHLNVLKLKVQSCVVIIREVLPNIEYIELQNFGFSDYYQGVDPKKKNKGKNVKSSKEVPQCTEHEFERIYFDRQELLIEKKYLPQLKYLHLHGYRIVKSLEPFRGSIVELTLNNCMFPKEEICGYTCLEYLSIGLNTNVKWLYFLPNLRYFWFCRTGVFPHFFSDEERHLINCPPFCLNFIRRLEKVEVRRGNQLEYRQEYVGEYSFRNFPQLQTVRIQNVDRFLSEYEIVLENNPNLECLEFDFLLSSLNDCSSLKKLKLYPESIESMKLMGILPNLESFEYQIYHSSFGKLEMTFLLHFIYTLKVLKLFTISSSVFTFPLFPTSSSAPLSSSFLPQPKEFEGKILKFVEYPIQLHYFYYLEEIRIGHSISEKEMVYNNTKKEQKQKKTKECVFVFKEIELKDLPKLRIFHVYAMIQQLKLKDFPNSNSNLSSFQLQRPQQRPQQRSQQQPISVFSPSIYSILSIMNLNPPPPPPPPPQLQLPQQQRIMNNNNNNNNNGIVIPPLQSLFINMKEPNYLSFNRRLTISSTSYQFPYLKRLYFVIPNAKKFYIKEIKHTELEIIKIYHVSSSSSSSKLSDFRVIERMDTQRMNQKCVVICVGKHFYQKFFITSQQEVKIITGNLFN